MRAKIKVGLVISLISLIVGILSSPYISPYISELLKPVYREDLSCAITIVDGLTGHPIPPEELKVELYSTNIYETFPEGPSSLDFTPDRAKSYLIGVAWYDTNDGKWKFKADAGKYIVLAYDYDHPYRYYPCVTEITVHETKREDRITEVEPRVLRMYKRASVQMKVSVRVLKGLNEGRDMDFINITADSEWWVRVEMEIGVSESATLLWLDRLYIDYIPDSGADNVIFPDYAIWKGNRVKIIYDRERGKYYIDLSEKIEVHKRYGVVLYVYFHIVKGMSVGTGRLLIELVDYYECQSWLLRWWRTPQVTIQVKV